MEQENKLYFEKRTDTGLYIVDRNINMKYNIYDLEVIDYYCMHNAVKRIMKKKPKFLWDYSIQLYNICDGKIRTIKRVIKELKKYDHNNRDKEYTKKFYDDMIKRYEGLNDRIINNFLFNDFSIIEEFKIEDDE